MFKLRQILVIVILLLAAATYSAGLAPQRIGVTTLPPRLVDPSGHYSYLWIAASELVDAEGRLDRTLLFGTWSESASRLEQRMAEAQAAVASGAEAPPCLRLVSKISYQIGSRPEFKSFADAVESAETIVRGTVTGSAGGFLRERAGHLLEIEVDARLRESPLYASSPYVYVFYYGGELSIGAACIAHSVGDWPDLPGVGDQIILFPRQGQPAVDAGATILALDTRGFEMVFGSSDRIGVPPGLREFSDLQKESDIEGVWRLTLEAFEHGKREGALP